MMNLFAAETGGKNVPFQWLQSKAQTTMDQLVSAEAIFLTTWFYPHG
jgi:hypothetical protein